MKKTPAHNESINVFIKKFDQSFFYGHNKIDSDINWSPAEESKRGGSRANAGRKPGDRVPYLTRLNPKLIKKIKNISKKYDIPECQVLEALLVKVFNYNRNLILTAILKTQRSRSKISNEQSST
jgi:hypothetical protein